MRASLAALSLTLCGLTAHAQLAQETASAVLDLKRSTPERTGPFEVANFRGRYAFLVACFQRLLPLGATFRRCVDAQRTVIGEFHGRLDFLIEPSGRLIRFTCRFKELEACVMPKALALRFPAFGGSGAPFELQVLVASPGVKLGRHVEANPIAVYPVRSDEERRTYQQAVSWVFSPWSQAIGLCAELVDQQLGLGYQMTIEVGLTPVGRPGEAKLHLRGKLASRALSLAVSCVTPFVRAMAVPAHAGPGPFRYRFGSNTAGWGIR